MLELKSEFNIIYDADGNITEPEIPDTRLIDFVVSRNAEDFGVVIKFQFEEEEPFLLSFEGCSTLNVKEFRDANFVSYIQLHTAEDLLDDEDLVVRDFKIEYPATKQSCLNWIRTSGISRIQIGPDAGADIVIYCKKIRAFR